MSDYSQSLGIKIEITDHSEEVLEALSNAVERGLESIGDSAVEHAVHNITEQGAVDTGNLRNSISKKLENDGQSVIIGTPVEYAAYVELGTSKMKSRPYLGPAVANNMDEYRSIMKDSLENA